MKTTHASVFSGIGGPEVAACDLSCCFTEEMTGTDSKSGFIRNYYDNN